MMQCSNFIFIKKSSILCDLHNCCYVEQILQICYDYTSSI